MKKSILKGEKFYPALQTILFTTHCSSSINNTNKYLILFNVSGWIELIDYIHNPFKLTILKTPFSLSIQQEINK